MPNSAKRSDVAQSRVGGVHETKVTFFWRASVGRLISLNVVGSGRATEEIQSSAKVGRLSGGSVVALIPSMSSPPIDTGPSISGVL